MVTTGNGDSGAFAWGDHTSRGEAPMASRGDVIAAFVEPSLRADRRWRLLRVGCAKEGVTGGILTGTRESGDLVRAERRLLGRGSELVGWNGDVSVVIREPCGAIFPDSWLLTGGSGAFGSTAGAGGVKPNDTDEYEMRDVCA